MTPPANSVGEHRPRLSIIVATFNCASVLQGCIDSIAAQTWRDWELLVADGGSTDGTAILLDRNRDLLAYAHSHPDRGIYDAWNQALEHASGEYVCFLGADDRYLHARSLATIFEAIGNRDFDIVTSTGVLVDATGASLHTFGGAWQYRRLMRRMTICHPGALHRRTLFDRFGGFDTSFRISADYDFLLRLPPDTRALHLDVPLVAVADGGISRRGRWPMLKERFRAQAKAPHVGPLLAVLNLIDKLWRIPVGRLLGIPT